MIRYQTINVDGIKIFYREAGKKESPAILLLHGMPSSSHMFRDLITALSDKFHLIAPDYPGFGNSDCPSVTEFEYSFGNLAKVMERFIELIGLTRFSLYMQDYGGPVGFRIATRHPKWMEALIIQNANAYEEGLGSGFDAIRALWKNRNPETEQKIRDFLKIDATKWQYLAGAGKPENVSPDSWNMDQFFLDRPANDAIQIELEYDYRNNPPRYPEWQAYFRTHQPRTLIVWGKNDPFFTLEGMHAYQRDLKNVQVHLLNAGHFALEEEYEAISNLISRFLEPS